MILGVMADDRFEQRVLYSRPYYVAKYQLVVRAGQGAPAADDLVGVEEGLAIRGLKGRVTKSIPSTEAILEAVAEGRVKSRLCDFDPCTLARLQAVAGASSFSCQPLKIVDCFPISAAVRKSDRDLKGGDRPGLGSSSIDRAAGEVFARWHVPYERPE